MNRSLKDLRDLDKFERKIKEMEKQKNHDH